MNSIIGAKGRTFDPGSRAVVVGVDGNPQVSARPGDHVGNGVGQGNKRLNRTLQQPASLEIFEDQRPVALGLHVCICVMLVGGAAVRRGSIPSSCLRAKRLAMREVSSWNDHEVKGKSLVGKAVQTAPTVLVLELRQDS